MEKAVSGMDDLISRLSELRCQYNCFDENERDAYHTLSEAIKALSDVPDTNVGDLISRQAAYEVLTAYYHHTTDIQHAALHEALNIVPPAVEVVRCQDCYHYDEESEKCILNNSEFKPTDYCSYGSR